MLRAEADDAWLDELVELARLSGGGGAIVLVVCDDEWQMGRLLRRWAELDRGRMSVATSLDMGDQRDVLLHVDPRMFGGLNLRRDLVAREGRLVAVWCSERDASALARQAPDFFDWISHRVDVGAALPDWLGATVRRLWPSRVGALAPGFDPSWLTTIVPSTEVVEWAAGDELPEPSMRRWLVMTIDDEEGPAMALARTLADEREDHCFRGVFFRGTLPADDLRALSPPLSLARASELLSPRFGPSAASVAALVGLEPDYVQALAVAEIFAPLGREPLSTADIEDSLYDLEPDEILDVCRFDGAAPSCLDRVVPPTVSFGEASTPTWAERWVRDVLAGADPSEGLEGEALAASTEYFPELEKTALVVAIDALERRGRFAEASDIIENRLLPLLQQRGEREALARERSRLARLRAASHT